MQQFLNDIAYHVRSLRRRWYFTIPIVLCLALGVGANSTVFSVVNAVLLRPLPFEEPDKLIILLDQLEGENYNVSPNNLVEWRQRSKSFTRLEALETRFFNVVGGDSPVRVPGGAVSARLLDLLGVKPALGRNFLPEEDVPGGPPVAMISYGLFARQFGADPKALERPLELDGKSYTIVGVLPLGAEGFFPRRFVVESLDVWVPLALDPAATARANSHYLYIVGRLADGVTLKNAQAEMKIITEQLVTEFPDTNTGWGVKVMTVRQNWVGHTGRKIVLLFAAVGFVLLIACANVSNLLLNRAAEQQGDMALRMAFGAGRWRLARQFMTESILLGLLGGALGLVLAFLTMRSLPLVLPAKLHNMLRGIEVDYRMLGFTFVIALLAGIIPGLLAVWRVSSQNLAQQFSELGHRSSAGVQKRFLRNGLVVAEIALTLVLLIGAGLMIQSLGRLGNSQTGFDTSNLLTLSVSLSGSREPEATTEFYRQIAADIRNIPGVSSVGVTSVLPITRFAVTTAFRVEDRAPDDAGEAISADFRRVDAEYFETLGISVLDGRSFLPSDNFESQPVAMISEELARRFWPSGNAVGRRILRGRDLAKATMLTIVGVVPEIQESDMGAEIGNKGTLYIPYTQGARPTMFMVVRSSMEATSLIPSVRSAVFAVDPNQPIAEVLTMEERIGKSLSDHRFATFMLIAFSGLSVILALVGLFSLMSYSVSRRTQEMGMRMALGATGRDIVKLVLSQTMTLTLFGLVAGVLLAIYLNRFLVNLLYEVQPTDPKTFAATCLVMLLTCALAGFRPAWQASRCQPHVALRSE